MSSQMFAKEDLVDRASFTADHTIDTCYQQPGILSIQPFGIDVLIRLLLVIICFTSRFEIKVKNSFPSSFQRAMGLKSLMLEGEGGLVLGI